MNKTHISVLSDMYSLSGETDKKHTRFPQIVRSVWSVSGEQRRLVGTGWPGKVSLDEVTFQLSPEG